MLLLDDSWSRNLKENDSDSGLPRKIHKKKKIRNVLAIQFVDGSLILDSC